MSSPRRTSPASGNQANDTARGLAGLPITNGRLVEVVATANGLVKLGHGLGRPYQGALACGTSTPIIVRPATPEASKSFGYDPSKFAVLYVETSTPSFYPSTIRLWVF